jgi:hypothetical protein
MYEVEAKSTDFKSRVNSTFEVLATLEATHKQKKAEYIEEKDVEENLEETQINHMDATCSNSKEFEFKVPELNLMKRPQAFTSKNNLECKNRKIQPDFVVNPDKWKKYSLEDVSDSQMSPSANYFAAINFLKQKEKIKGSNRDEFDKFEKLADRTELLNDSSLFNKPIGGSVKKSDQHSNDNKIEKKLLENLSESKEIDDDSENTEHFKTAQKSESQFQFTKKKSSRRNLRTKVEDNENEVESSSKQESSSDPSQTVDDKCDEENHDIEVDIDDYLS